MIPKTSTHFDLHRCMHTHPHAYTQNTKFLKSIIWSKNKKSNKYNEKCNQDSIAPSAVHFCNCCLIYLLKLEVRLSQFSSCNAWHFFFFWSLFLYHWLSFSCMLEYKRGLARFLTIDRHLCLTCINKFGHRWSHWLQVASVGSIFWYRKRTNSSQVRDNKGSQKSQGYRRSSY